MVGHFFRVKLMIFLLVFDGDFTLFLSLWLLFLGFVVCHFDDLAGVASRLWWRFGGALVIMTCVGVGAAFAVVSTGANLTPDGVMAADWAGSVVMFCLQIVVGAPVPVALAYVARVRIHCRRRHAAGNFVVHDGKGAQR